MSKLIEGNFKPKLIIKRNCKNVGFLVCSEETKKASVCANILEVSMVGAEDTVNFSGKNIACQMAFCKMSDINKCKKSVIVPFIQIMSAGTLKLNTL